MTHQRTGREPVARLRARTGTAAGSESDHAKGQHSPRSSSRSSRRCSAEPRPDWPPRHARHGLPLLRPARPRGRRGGSCPELREVSRRGRAAHRLHARLVGRLERGRLLRRVHRGGARDLGQRALLLIGDAAQPPRASCPKVSPPSTTRPTASFCRARRRSSIRAASARPAQALARRPPRARRALQPRPVRQRLARRSARRAVACSFARVQRRARRERIARAAR